MQRLAPLAILLAFAAAAGCGGTSAELDPAPVQTLPLGWREFQGVRGAGFELEVRSLRITEHGWSVAAAVTNRTDLTFFITRPHRRNETKFGLFVFESARPDEWKRRIAAGQLTPVRLATNFDPPIPRLLEPGARWTGTFSGPGGLAPGSYVRISFGRFVTTQSPPAELGTHLLAVTRRTVQIPSR